MEVSLARVPLPLAGAFEYENPISFCKNGAEEETKKEGGIKVVWFNSETLPQSGSSSDQSCQ